MSFDSLLKRNKRRSKRARTMDSLKQARNTFDMRDSKKDINKWIRHPNRYDIKGIDTPMTQSDIYNRAFSKHQESNDDISLTQRKKQWNKVWEQEYKKMEKKTKGRSRFE